jgi:hypothetical protein
MVDDYLLGQATLNYAQEQGIALSPDYTSAFKNFEKSLDLPEGIFSFKKMDIELNIPTHTPQSFVAEISKDSTALFDPDTGSKSLSTGYEKSRDNHHAIYEMISTKLNDKDLFQQYGSDADQQLYEKLYPEIAKIYRTLNKENRTATADEQIIFNQLATKKQELLQKQKEYEEVVKLAMGRSFISGQAIQHLKRLNSATGNTFNFNMANAFEMQGNMLTTTVYAQGSDNPFKIRTDTAQP